MARSNYIYIVTGNKNILSAFTVKHELESWLNDNDEFYQGLYQDFNIFRFSHADFGIKDITNEYYEDQD